MVDPLEEPTGEIPVADLWADDEPAAAPPLAVAVARRRKAPRVPRADRPGALPPARAVAGAAVAVAGVVLGIGTLLWATDSPDGDPTVRAPASQQETAVDTVGDEPAVALPGDPVPPVEVPAPAPPPPAAVEPPPPPPAAPAEPAFTPTPVLVINNSRIDGLAERAAAYFEREGWPVRDIGSSRGKIRATTIYYPPGQEAMAREFARRFPEIQRVLPRLENLPGSGLTVVVTRDFRP